MAHRHVIDLSDEDDTMLRSAMARRGGHFGVKAHVFRQALRIFCELDAGNNDRAMEILKELRGKEVESVG